MKTEGPGRFRPGPSSCPPGIVERRVAVEERGEVCLAEEAEKLRRSGVEMEEIAGRMGVDVAWVETVISPYQEEDEPEPEKD